jgi:hypothetical protein
LPPFAECRLTPKTARIAGINSVDAWLLFTPANGNRQSSAAAGSQVSKVTFSPPCNIGLLTERTIASEGVNVLDISINGQTTL